MMAGVRRGISHRLRKGRRAAGKTAPGDAPTIQSVSPPFPLARSPLDAELREPVGRLGVGPVAEEKLARDDDGGVAVDWVGDCCVLFVQMD